MLPIGMGRARVHRHYKQLQSVECVLFTICVMFLVPSFPTSCWSTVYSRVNSSLACDATYYDLGMRTISDVVMLAYPISCRNEKEAHSCYRKQRVKEEAGTDKLHERASPATRGGFCTDTIPRLADAGTKSRTAWSYRAKDSCKQRSPKVMRDFKPLALKPIALLLLCVTGSKGNKIFVVKVPVYCLLYV